MKVQGSLAASSLLIDCFSNDGVARSGSNTSRDREPLALFSMPTMATACRGICRYRGGRFVCRTFVDDVSTTPPRKYLSIESSKSRHAFLPANASPRHGMLKLRRRASAYLQSASSHMNLLCPASEAPICFLVPLMPPVSTLP